MRDDRVEDREEGAEDEVDPELRALGHRAPDDRQRDAGEDDLEQVARRARDRREERERRGADREERVRGREEAARPDEAVAVAERDPEADGPVDDRADAEDEHVLAGDVRRVLHPGQPGFEEGEPGLHEHHEHGRDDDPDRVDGDDEVGGLHATSTSPSGRPVRLWVTFSIGVVQTIPSPDSCPDRAASAIAATTAARDRVLDDEREERLRQEARLEHAAAVLVRHAALASVADRLDHGHAHVAGLRLDRVDHRLDPLADHDRLDLRHVITSLRRSRTTTSLQTPSSFPSRSCVPTTRKPHFSCSARLASFSGKTPVWIVQIPSCLGALEQPLEQRAPDSPALPLVVDVDAVLDDAAVAGPRRHRVRRGPAHDLPALDGHPPMAVELRAVPCFPRGSLGLEGRVPAGDALLEDRAHRRPVLLPKLPDLQRPTRRSRGRTRPGAA